jgi:hypothetical protein
MRLGDRSVFAQNGTQIWDSEEDREASYWAHRDRILKMFRDNDDDSPPNAAVQYEPPVSDIGPRAVAYYVRKLQWWLARGDRMWAGDTDPGTDRASILAAIEELEALDPPAPAEADRIFRAWEGRDAA